LLYSKAVIQLSWAIFVVLDPSGEEYSGFLFTEHLFLWCNEISVKEPRNFNLQRQNLNQENFSPLRYRKLELYKFELWEKHNMKKEFFSGNMNSV
jgi:hypothetical protein